MKFECKSVGELLIVEAWNLTIILHPFVNTEASIIQLKGYSEVIRDEKLIVPNVKNAQLKSIIEISTEINELAEVAKKRKLKIADLKGSSFSISSLGAIGGRFFTPIINPPEVAILGIGKSFDKLTKLKNKIVSRKILPISLSYDHRIIDGAEGARFCVYLSDCLGKDFAFKLAV